MMNISCLVREGVCLRDEVGQPAQPGAADDPDGGAVGGPGKDVVGTGLQPRRADSV